MRMYIFERTVESAKRNHQLRSVRIYGQRVPTKSHFATFLLSRRLRVVTRVHQAKTIQGHSPWAELCVSKASVFTVNTYSQIHYNGSLHTGVHMYTQNTRTKSRNVYTG